MVARHRSAKSRCSRKVVVSVRPKSNFALCGVDSCRGQRAEFLPPSTAISPRGPADNAMKGDPTLQQKIYQFQVVGRKRPTEGEAQPPLYRMRLFARNKVLAVSKFWYLLKKMKKVKKSKGEVLAVNEIREKRPTYVKNFGIWLRYDSRTGTHNMYKEIRDVSQNGAVSQLYAEMAGRHRALPSSIQIIRVAQIKASQCRRPHMLQLFDSKLKLPAIRRIIPVPKNRKTTFCARKPTLFLR